MFKKSNWHLLSPLKRAQRRSEIWASADGRGLLRTNGPFFFSFLLLSSFFVSTVFVASFFLPLGPFFFLKKREELMRSTSLLVCPSVRPSSLSSALVKKVFWSRVLWVCMRFMWAGEEEKKTWQEEEETRSGITGLNVTFALEAVGKIRSVYCKESGQMLLDSLLDCT